MFVQDFIFQESHQFTGANTFYTPWVSVDQVYELLAFLKISAKGSYTDETMNISVQTKTPEGDSIDLTDVVFQTITNPSLPYFDYISFANFGSQIRFKIVTTGTAPDYTLSISGYGKR